MSAADSPYLVVLVLAALPVGAMALALLWEIRQLKSESDRLRKLIDLLGRTR